MDAIRMILPRVLHRRGLHSQARASLVTHAAQQWIHKALPQCAELLSVDTLTNATLCISCVHSVAAQECVSLLPSLQEYLQREFSPETVREIRIMRTKRR